AFEFLLGGTPVPLVVGPDVGVHGVSFRQRLVELERTHPRRTGLRQHRDGCSVREEWKGCVVVREANVRRRPTGRETDGLLEQRPGLLELSALQVETAAEVRVVCPMIDLEA